MPSACLSSCWTAATRPALTMCRCLSTCTTTAFRLWPRKLKKSEMAARKEEFEKICAPYGCQGIVLTSAENGLGMDELRALLEASMTPETED